jgi:hypothetical protein
MRAQDVLSDCKRALEDFKAAGPTPYWRTRWNAVVALVRAVGHVLKTIDAAQSPELRMAVADAWARLNQTKPEPRIFWEFIEAERNNVLKAYEVGAQLNAIVRPGPAILSFSDSIAPYQKSNATSYESFMRSGFYGGRDALALCREAIAFAEKFLVDVEAAAESERP